jgi:hypothetical protein
MGPVDNPATQRHACAWAAFACVTWRRNSCGFVEPWIWATTSMAGACAGWVVGTKGAFFMSRWCCGFLQDLIARALIGNLPKDPYLVNNGSPGSSPEWIAKRSSAILTSVSAQFATPAHAGARRAILCRAAGPMPVTWPNWQTEGMDCSLSTPKPVSPNAYHADRLRAACSLAYAARTILRVPDGRSPQPHASSLHSCMHFLAFSRC